MMSSAKISSISFDLKSKMEILLLRKMRCLLLSRKYCLPFRKNKEEGNKKDEMEKGKLWKIDKEANVDKIKCNSQHRN